LPLREDDVRATPGQLHKTKSPARHCHGRILAVASAVALMGSLGTAFAADNTKSIGLALSTMRFYVNPDSDMKQDCPEGLQAGEYDEFKAQFPNAEAILRQTEKGISYQSRGPNGESSPHSPWAIKDPIPARYLEGNVGYGMNLDRTTDGRETEKTCKHEKFKSPDGETGIDNQMYRVLGCVMGYRAGGWHYLHMTNQIRNVPENRILIEVTGVDDMKNDDHVEITFHRGNTRLLEDNVQPTPNVIPWGTQMVNDLVPEVVVHMTGKIVNGVLETDPIEFRLPVFELHAPYTLILHNMRMRLTLNDTGAKGMMVGYSDVDGFYKQFIRSNGITNLANYSAPALYNGLHRFADGDKDPQTGQCRAISTVYQIETTRVFIVHPPARDKGAQTAQAQTAPAAP
jgi:hypothetical protein